jgi:hypothetical protein
MPKCRITVMEFLLSFMTPFMRWRTMAMSARLVHAQSAQTVPAHVHALADHGMLSATHFSSTCGDYNI